VLSYGALDAALLSTAVVAGSPSSPAAAATAVGSSVSSNWSRALAVV
jgi:hypothetical protein